MCDGKCGCGGLGCKRVCEGCERLTMSLKDVSKRMLGIADERDELKREKDGWEKAKKEAVRMIVELERELGEVRMEVAGMDWMRRNLLQEGVELGGEPEERRIEVQEFDEMTCFVVPVRTMGQVRGLEVAHD